MLDYREKFLMELLEGGLKVERPNGSTLHALVDAFAGTEACTYLLRSQVFVFEHDWAAAFSNAVGFDGGEHRLPFDDCVFEFKLSGHRFAAYYQWREDEEPKLSAVLFAKLPYGWAAFEPLFYYLNEEWWAKVPGELQQWDTPSFQVFHFVDAQVRAITVGLEAGAAIGVPQLAPKPSTQRKRSGLTQPRDYRIVQLRPTSRPSTDHHLVGARSVRLHFRRGHYWPANPEDRRRHWRKWTLVGNPDLGFIDKHYRVGAPS